jgi:hypothetical protein
MPVANNARCCILFPLDPCEALRAPRFTFDNITSLHNKVHGGAVVRRAMHLADRAAAGRMLGKSRK